MVSTPQNSRYRRAHDPYNDMETAITRPQNIARQQLSDAEKTAANSATDPSKSNSTSISQRLANSLRQSEQNQTSTAFASNFRNSVSGKSSLKTSNKSRIFKRFAPLTVITAILFGGGAFFYGAQSLLAPHLSSLYTNATDVQFTSYSMRNQRLFKYLMDGGDQIKISNFTKKYTTFTPYMKKRLQANGIEVGYLDTDGNFNTDQIIANKSTVLKYNDEIIDANSFQDKFATDANFREDYYQAKRGRLAGFFDDSSEYFYKKKGATRDIFDQYKSTGDKDTDTENFQKTVSDRVTGSDATVNTARQETDKDGNETVDKNGEDLTTTKVEGDTPEAKAHSLVNSLAGKVSSVGVPVCSALRIANIAAVTVSAYQIVQSIAYFLSMMEPVSKMMAQEGDTSGINETLNFLTEQTTTNTSYVDSDGTSKTATVTGSPLESAGAKLVLGNTKSSQQEITPYSLDNITKAATTIAVSTGLTTTTCSGVMAASAIVSLASTGIPGGKLATIAVGAIAQTVGGIVMTGIVAAVVSAIIPYVAKIFTENIFSTYTGIPAGNLFSQGAAAANFGNATQSSAYMPSSEDNVKTQNRNTTLALADEAELDRLNRSPFDISSQNTFLGSLLSKFSYASYSNSIVSSITNISSIVGSSIRSLTPLSSAADQDLSYTSTYTECTNLSGVMCDMYGQPIVTSDYSTVDLSPDDPTYQAVLKPNLEYTTSTSTSSTTTASTWSGQKYNLSDGQISGLMAVIKGENGGSLEAMQSEATIMANLFEHNKPNADRTGDNLVDYVLHGGWFASSTTSQYNEANRDYTSAEFNAIKDIFVNGNRTMPAEILEHDCIDCGDITSASNDGVEFSTSDRSQYVSGKTILKNRYGSTYVFYKFATNSTREGDPFGYFQDNPPASSSSSTASSSTTPTEKIKDNSELAKFINYCVNRESPWGVTDANILNSLQTDFGVVANNMPVVGDITNVINAAEDATNQKWATGENCENSSSNPRWDSEFKYYQRYIEDTRILSGMSGSTNSNPVLAYEESYDEKHPIDTSLEGTLARISGYTKDDIAFMLEVTRYSNELAEYDPTTKYQFGHQTTDTKISLDQPAINPTYVLSLNFPQLIVDKRNYTV